MPGSAKIGYRFYADDLAHPAPQAVEYIWEKFTAAALDDEARHLLPEVEALVTAAHHRSRNPHSEAIVSLPEVPGTHRGTAREHRFHRRKAGFRALRRLNAQHIVLARLRARNQKPAGT